MSRDMDLKRLWTNMYAKTCALCWIKVEVSMRINHSHRQENVSALGGFPSIIDLVLASWSDRRSTIQCSLMSSGRAVKIQTTHSSSKARKKNVLVPVISRVHFDANKKKLQAAKYNKTPSSPVNHRRSTELLTITKTCSFSNFNLQDKILLCLAWFATILEHEKLFLKLHFIFD